VAISDFLAQPGLPRPRVSHDEAARIAQELYGVSGDITELGSQQDRNFRIDDGTTRWMLKFSNPVFGVEELEAQDAAARAVQEAGLAAPRAIASVAGRTVETTVIGGLELPVRLLTYVEGEPMTGPGEFSADDARTLGATAARVAVALAGIEHAGTARTTQWNLRIGGEVVEVLLPFVADTARRERVAQAAGAALARLDGIRGRLRTQTTHGDVVDDNVVRSGDGAIGDGAITGVIDFGDVAESWTVAELAVACVAILHHNARKPLIVLETIAAFASVLPLDDDEVRALWPLVQLRTAVLVVSGEQQVALDGVENAYAHENRRHEWRAFETATELDAARMEVLIRWRLGDRSAPFRPAGTLTDLGEAAMVDLSTTSSALDFGAWLETDAEARLLAEVRDEHGAAVTAWGEARLTRAVVRSSREVATVPLGVEIAGNPGTLFLAPAGGVLRHVDDAVVLATEGYDLWLSGLEAAADEGAVDAGTRLGVLPGLTASAGPVGVQLSRLAGGERPPFFVAPSQADAWKLICPDPSPLLGLAPRAETVSGAELLAERDTSFATVQEHYYADPPRIERGWREHFVDTDGQTYLDMVNNVATAGHGHPRLVEAVSRQWARLNTNSRFHYAAVAEFSARLAALAPDPLDTVFLVNSGSEAVDLALRLVTTATARPTVLSVREAYHGWTIGSDAVSSSIGDNPRALETRPAWVRLIDAPNTFRGTHRGSGSGPAYLADLDTQLARLDADGVEVAGFIAEAVYGNAGGVLLPDGYLAGVYSRVRERGGLCIADEVQVGYGRLGEHFWGFEQQGAVPDVITIAKAMGNGHPLGAVITTRAIADAFAAEGSMFSSAGGSPVSCVVGMTVLDILEDEALQQNALVVGGALRAGLEELAVRHELIGAVHGLGLYLGVELVRSRETLEPATAEAAAICDALLGEGVIVQPTGDHKNVLKIKPPMLLTRESAEFFVAALDRVLDAL
jgi:4-aminobutyrate aminotransferase-like enzyme/Ser/Thr protein kinase RdoA (MazF antagonist)